ncbi:MAG: 3,5-nucleoside bisphosphate phosphatase [Clostridia bacterium]|nr:3,5-nucleoside bisphosphate phosphatase [Clostridia bacterium]
MPAVYTACLRVKMRIYYADLHLHTALSPCAAGDMTPPAIIDAAGRQQLDIIGITDHNTAGNARAVIEAAAGTGLLVLPGMEVQTQEDVHLVCLFPKIELAETWQEEVYRLLPPQKNRIEIFGPQLLLDACGEVRGYEERLLVTGIRAGVAEVASRVKALRGLVIPAHVDRPSYSLLNVLGFLPTGLEVAALELGLLRAGDARRQWGSLCAGLPLVASSDAHSPADIGRRRTLFNLEKLSFEEIALALQGLGGRGVEAF